MFGRVIWLAILIGLAAVTTAVHLDREARRTPALAMYVPEFFRSGAQPRITALAIDTGVPGVGVAQAETLVRRRPLPARHLRLLAQAHFAEGNNEASALAIQYAAQRGWRDGMAQEAMMRIALVAGNRPEAARRYAALFLDSGSDRALLKETGDAVFPQAGAEERAVFAQIVAGGERWHNAFLTGGARVLPPDAFVEIVEISAREGAQFRCPTLRRAQQAIERNDQILGKRLSSIVQSQC